ncbi:DinB superfamily protein [Lishizhenia tianjinensis]|uniref:DinB superfamily protein n=1 Tax=Lishizhenia tianjinensis TaxID=477690 RepID=A0A1I6XHN5_9FLAO|nr:DinB family protein [Lishizhenia tianjinensis]SFT37532.1 DinB superfamily protein [Lishizhenia tianjinensis]
METQKLIEQLIGNSERHLQFAEACKKIDISHLNYKANAESWSVLECIEHLNLYGDFYNPSLKQSLSKAKPAVRRHFKPGLLGNYFTQSMYPKEKLNKMKTFKDKNPVGSTLNLSHLDRFINQQHQFIELLKEAEHKNLNFKTPISISKWLKLKLGDTFHFVSAHNERHIQQAKRILNQQKINL